MPDDTKALAAQIDDLRNQISALQSRQNLNPVRPVREPYGGKDELFKDGTFKDQSGATFKLRIVEDDPRGRTHKLRGPSGFWEGTKDEFKKAFEKP